MKTNSMVQLAPAHKIDYVAPDNFNESDRGLFYDVNFSNLIPAVEMVTIQNISISNKYLFNQCIILDRYTSHVSVSFRVRFKSYVKKYIKSIQKIDEVILGIQDWDHNYFHWMTEVLPAILAMRERKAVPVLLNSNSIKQKHIVNSLELFQIPFVIHDIYNKTGRISKLHMVKVPVVAEYNKQVMFKLQHFFYEKLGIGSQLNPRKKIYISREKANRRKVSNENELISMLVNKGFEVVYLEEYSLAEQVILLSEAETVVGIHGAGLTNIMFMKPTTTVIELKAKDNDYWCFFSLARLFNLKYKYLLCDTDGTSHRDANIEVPIQQLKKIIL